MLRYSRSLALFGFIAVLAMDARAFRPDVLTRQTLWIDDDDPTCGGFSPCYSTIQEAVAAAQPGETLKIRSGTYMEQITINKDLTLSGESKDLVFIKGAETEGQGDWGIIKITESAIVMLEGVTVLDGAIGVYVSGRNAQVTISNTRFSKHIVAIMAAVNSPSETGQLAVLNSEISNNSSVGLELGILIAMESFLPHRIEGNLFMNNSTAISVVNKGIVIINDNKLIMNGKGIEIKGSVKASIQANVVQNNANGVQVHDTAGVQLKMNQITDNSLNGVIVRDSAHVTLTDNQITGNGLSSNSLSVPLSYDPFWGFLTSGGIFQPQGFGVVVGFAASVELTENRIEDNLFGVGAAKARYPTSNQFLTPRLVAQGNQIIENGWGVWLRGAEAALKDNEIAQNDVIALPIDPRLVAWLEFLFPASGVLVESGQPLVQSNRITRNGLGVVLQGQSSPTMLDNQILNNSQYGIALYQKPCFDQLTAEQEFQGKVLGEANELSGNGQGDLCPADYPWPPGFRK